MIWPKRPLLAFSVAETSVAEMSGPKRPRPKCPWPKCPTFNVTTNRTECTYFRFINPVALLLLNLLVSEIHQVKSTIKPVTWASTCENLSLGLTTRLYQNWPALCYAD